MDRFLTYRILLQEKRNCLLMQLEEATRLASYLQSQLKRWVTVTLERRVRERHHSLWLVFLVPELGTGSGCKHGVAKQLRRIFQRGC